MYVRNGNRRWIYSNQRLVLRNYRYATGNRWFCYRDGHLPGCIGTGSCGIGSWTLQASVGGCHFRYFCFKMKRVEMVRFKFLKNGFSGNEKSHHGNQTDLF